MGICMGNTEYTTESLVIPIIAVHGHIVRGFNTFWSTIAQKERKQVVHMWDVSEPAIATQGMNIQYNII